MKWRVESGYLNSCYSAADGRGNVVKIYIVVDPPFYVAMINMYMIKAADRSWSFTFAQPGLYQFS